MRTIGLKSLAVSISLVIYSVSVNSASKEDMDLGFLPLENNEESSSVNNQEGIFQENKGGRFKSTLNNTFQVNDWKEQRDQSFDLPTTERANWSNLTRFGLRSEFCTNDWVTLKAISYLMPIAVGMKGWIPMTIFVSI